MKKKTKGGRWAWKAAVALCVATFLGCGYNARQIQAQTAAAIASSANAALPLLVDRYESEGADIVARATTRQEAEEHLAEWKDAWEPVWTAWELLRVAQESWAVALETDEDAALRSIAGVHSAYCGLLELWPEDLPAIPLAPLSCRVDKAAASAAKGSD